MFTRGRCKRSWLLLAVIAARPTLSLAADKSWGSIFGGTFSNPVNWQNGSVAGTGDVAHFGLTTNPILLQRIYTVEFSADATNQALKIEDDFVTFLLNGHTYATTLTTGNEIGNVAGRTGKLTINNGVMSLAANSELDIGSVPTAAGALTVSTGGELRGGAPGGAGLLVVGNFGAGSLTVSDGALVKSDSSFIASASGITGTATVTGAGSQWINSGLVSVGTGGQATLSIMAGGQVQNTSGTVGRVAGSIGVVTVDGANSQWINSSALTVAAFGDGTLNVSGGGLVQDVSAVVGSEIGRQGMVTVDGANSQWITSQSLIVGDSGAGTINITAGGKAQANFCTLGSTDFGHGVLTVSGAGSQWTGALVIGDDGSGTLSITAGGHAQSLGITDLALSSNGHGQGAVNVSGANSQWTTDFLSIGIFGRGSVNVSNGGSVQSNSNSFLGGTLEGEGQVTVDGANSQWTISADLGIGTFGIGTMDITNGGLVQDVNASVGSGQFGSTARGTVTVSGANSMWINSGSLKLDSGSFAPSQLNVLAGGQVQDSAGFIGAISNNNAFVTVDGINSLWINTITLEVGSVGRGILTISGGGEVQSADVRIGGSGGSGAITVDGAGSKLTTSTNLIVGGSSGTATLNITNGGKVQSANATISSGPSFASAIVTLSGAGSQWINTGSLTVGFGGTVSYNGGSLSAGSLIVNSGRLFLSSGGNKVINAKGVSVTGGSPFPGIINLNDNAMIIDYALFSPLVTIKGLIAAGYSGGTWTQSDTGNSRITSSAAEFASSSSHKTALGYAEAAAFGLNSFHGQSVDSTTLLIAHTWSGDANLDGVVNALDFNALASAFGGTSGRFWYQGDFNYDGATNTLDFNALAQNFNQPLLGSAALGALIPEPASLAMLTLLPLSVRPRRQESHS